MGGTTVKRVGDREYLYYSYYDADGKKVSRYCGHAGDPGAERRAAEFECTNLTSQAARLVRKMAAIRTSLETDPRCLDVPGASEAARVLRRMEREYSKLKDPKGVRRYPAVRKGRKAARKTIPG